jgi:hypothetical protein
MKWIGQSLVDFIARFRSDVYLDSLTTTTDTSVLVVDSNNKVCKNTTTLGGDITSVVAGVGLSGGATSGAATLTVDFSEFSDITPESGDKLATLGSDGASEQLTTVDSLATLYAGAGLTASSSVISVDATQSQITSLGSAGATTNILAGDLNMYNAVNDGNPTISLGSSSANRLEIKSTYNSGAQTLCDVNFTTYTASGTSNDGRFIFEVDDVEVLRLLDSGILAPGNVSLKGDIQVTNETASSATEGGAILLRANDGAAMGDDHRLGVIEFKGAEDGASTMSIGARIQAVARGAWGGSDNDADLEFYTTDGTTESKALTLDADNLASFAGAVTVSSTLTLDSVGLSRVQTSAESFSDDDTSIMTSAAIQDKIYGTTTVGTIGTGVWQGTAIATAYIADDAVTFAKASGVTPNIYGSVIKLIPSDFATNTDGGNTKFGMGYTDVAGTGYGMRVPNNATELYAFVSIPEGMKATHVDLYDKNDIAFEVFEIQINATTMVSKGSGNCNTTLDITDVNASATNMLAIEYQTGDINDRLYGGIVTIAAQ